MNGIVAIIQNSKVTDTSPPIIGELTGGDSTQVSINISCTAVDDTGILGYNIYVDGVFHLYTLRRELIDYPVRNLNAGTEYDIYVVASDYEGNLSDPSNTITTSTLDLNPFESPDMNGPTDPYGIASASTEYDDGTNVYEAWKGMNPNQLSFNMWASDRYDTWDGSGEWIDWRLRVEDGELFNYPMIPDSIRLVPSANRNEQWYLDHNPREMEVFGVKSDGSLVSIRARETLNEWNDGLSRTYDIDTTEECIGIRVMVYETMTSFNGGYFQAAFGTVKFTGHLPAIEDPIFESRLICDADITIEFSGSGEVNWGDGSALEAFDGNDIPLTHTYAAFDGNFQVYGTLVDFRTTNGTFDFIHNLSALPEGLVDYWMYGQSHIGGGTDTFPRSLIRIRLYGANTVSGDIANLPPDANQIYIEGNNILSGDIGNVPSTLGYISFAGSNEITGDLADLSNLNLTYLSLTASNINTYTSPTTFSSSITTFSFIAGPNAGLDSNEIDNILIDLDTSGMPGGVLNLSGNNAPRTPASDVAVANLESRGIVVTVHTYTFVSELTVDGEIQMTVQGVGSINWGDGSALEYFDSIDADLLLIHTYTAFDGIFIVNGTLTKFICNTHGSIINHDISALPDEMTYYQVYGDNTIYGNLGDLPINIRTFLIQGNNIITGNISDLPDTMDYIILRGNATINGTVADIPESITKFTLYGSGNMTGDIGDISDNLDNIDIGCSNTITGDIGNLKTLKHLYCGSNNTLTGDLSTLPVELIYFVVIGNHNTISGDVGDLVDNMKYFLIHGENTTTGDLANLPVNLIEYENMGLNTVTGDIATLPVNLVKFRNRGNNTVNTYTAGHVFLSTITYFLSIPASGYGLDSTEIDNLLIDLNTSGMLSGSIHLTEPNAPRTSASDTAVSELEDRGITVETSAGVPIVGELTIDEITDTSCRLHCTATDETGIDHWALITDGSWHEDSSDGSTLDHVMTGLSAETSYDISALAYDVDGNHGTSNVVTITTAEEMPVFVSNLVMDGEITFEVIGTGTIDWGDGSPTEDYDGIDIILTHTYTTFDGYVGFIGTLTSFINDTDGSNLSHDVSALPRDMIHYGNYGDNEVFGNIVDLPDTLTGLYLYGNNTVTGVISELPRGLTSIYLLGSCNITGDIIDMPPTTSYWAVYGTGVYSGDITNLPDTLTTIDAGGVNEITGDIINLKTALNWFEVSGNNTVTGDVVNFPVDMTGWISVGGSNTLTGDLSTIPLGVDHLSLAGNNSVDIYTSGKVWPATTDYVMVHQDGNGFDETEVDNILIDLDASGMATGNILLMENNAPRSPASDAAVAALEARGVIVQTNS